MNICGCLIHAHPNFAADVVATLSSIAGVEVHGTSDGGRIIVVVEDVGERPASATIMNLHKLRGVISITLTYHHFEDLPVPDARAELIRHKEAGGKPNDHL